jgi:putative resolvase
VRLSDLTAVLGRHQNVEQELLQVAPDLAMIRIVPQVALRCLLSDPSASVVVVEHRDRLARFGVEHVGAALSVQGRRVVVADLSESTDDGGTTDGLVRDVVGVVACMCVRLYGCRGAGSRAMRAVTAAKTTALVPVPVSVSDLGVV